MKYFPAVLTTYLIGILAMRLSATGGAWTKTQLIWLNGGAAFLATLLIGYIVAYGARSIHRAGRVSAIATLMIAATLGYGQRADIMFKFSEVMIRTAPTAAVVSPVGTANVPRHWDGHFRAAANVNGHNIDMLVDTGASLVLLTFEDALIAGVDTGALDFNVPILTANGRSHVATLEIAKIDIGGVIVEDVEAAVAERGQLHASLLGMSFLGAIEEAVIRKDRLILKN